MSDSITFAAVIEAARELTQERDKLRKQLAEIEEREGVCCPEDIGFDEYIKILNGKIGILHKQLTIAIGWVKYYAPEMAYKDILAEIEKIKP